MLNIWGVILYLRLPWITAQAGIGEWKKQKQKNHSSFVLIDRQHRRIKCHHSHLIVFSRSDLGDHPAVLVYNWHHWALYICHRHQRQSERRFVPYVINYWPIQVTRHYGHLKENVQWCFELRVSRLERFFGGMLASFMLWLTNQDLRPEQNRGRR